MDPYRYTNLTPYNIISSNSLQTTKTYHLGLNHSFHLADPRRKTANESRPPSYNTTGHQGRPLRRGCDSSCDRRRLPPVGSLRFYRAHVAFGRSSVGRQCARLSRSHSLGSLRPRARHSILDQERLMKRILVSKNSRCVGKIMVTISKAFVNLSVTIISNNMYG